MPRVVKPISRKTREPYYLDAVFGAYPVLSYGVSACMIKFDFALTPHHHHLGK